MLPISPQMIPQDRLMALQPRRRRPPSAHRHEIHRNIFRRNAVDIDQPQQLLEIRSHLKLQVKRTQTLIHMPAAIKRRMRRHEAEPHLPPAERTRTIIPHAFGQIVRIYEMNVAIHRIHPLYLARHTLQHIVRRIKIITVEYPHTSPVANAIPLFIASYSPRSGSLIHLNLPSNRPSYSLTMSRVLSVDCPSITITSTSRYPCLSTLSKVCPIVTPLFHVAVMTDIFISFILSQHVCVFHYSRNTR